MKTYGDIILFINFADSWLAQEQNKDESKFRYAVSRMRRRLMKQYEEFREASIDIDVEHCATDKDGVVLKDSKGGFEFKKEDLVKRNIAQRELRRKEVLFEPYLATEPPTKPLSDEEVEICEGFVIKETNGT